MSELCYRLGYLYSTKYPSLMLACHWYISLDSRAPDYKLIWNMYIKDV